MSEDTSPTLPPSPSRAEPATPPVREQPPQSAPPPVLPEPNLSILSPTAKGRLDTSAQSPVDLDKLLRPTDPDA
jgi:hypothetical protein